MVIQQAKRALGSDALLTVNTVTDADALELLEVLWLTVDAFEARFSRFKTDSELTAFNHAAGNRTIISPEFQALLVACLYFAERTDGAFNPFILPALQRVGYGGSLPNTTDLPAELDMSDRRVHGIDALEIGDDWASIPADAALDFGGIGKGYLLDRLADLTPDVCKGYWYSLGGDIIASGVDDDGKPWELGIASAEDASLELAKVTTKSNERTALATSGVTKRGGPGWHHILDPKTGEPAKTDILTASVCAPTATEADVLASSLVALGSQAAEPWLRSHSLRGLLQLQQSTPHSRNIINIGM